MKILLLPLLLLGGLYYLRTQRYSFTKSKSKSEVFKIGSKEIGCSINNDCKLIVYNEQKALNYAFNKGKIFYSQDIEYSLDDKSETKSIGLPGVYGYDTSDLVVQLKM